MGRFLRWGNWAVAKFIEALFNTSSLSDVGCTMRLVKGDAVRGLQSQFTVHDGAFGPEMMLLSIIGGWRVIQIPVNYRARHGVPGTTDSFSKALHIGLQMIALITRYWTRRSVVVLRLASNGGVRLTGPGPERPRAGGEPAHMLPRLGLYRRFSRGTPTGPRERVPR